MKQPQVTCNAGKVIIHAANKKQAIMLWIPPVELIKDCCPFYVSLSADWSDFTDNLALLNKYVTEGHPRMQTEKGNEFSRTVKIEQANA